MTKRDGLGTSHVHSSLTRRPHHLHTRGPCTDQRETKKMIRPMYQYVQGMHVYKITRVSHLRWQWRLSNHLRKTVHLSYNKIEDREVTEERTTENKHTRTRMIPKTVSYDALHPPAVQLPPPPATPPAVCVPPPGRVFGAAPTAPFPPVGYPADPPRVFAWPQPPPHTRIKITFNNNKNAMAGCTTTTYHRPRHHQQWRAPKLRTSRAHAS